MILSFFKKFFIDNNKNTIIKFTQRISKINFLESYFSRFTDIELKKKHVILKKDF